MVECAGRRHPCELRGYDPTAIPIQYTIIFSSADRTGYFSSGAINALILVTANLYNAGPPALLLQFFTVAQESVAMAA